MANNLPEAQREAAELDRAKAENRKPDFENAPWIGNQPVPPEDYDPNAEHVAYDQEQALKDGPADGGTNTQPDASEPVNQTPKVDDKKE